MPKIKTLPQIQKTVQSARSQGQTVGLITGCFDVLHLGHISLFRFAKRHVDVLVVGLENDTTIKLSKGQNRPVHNSDQRSDLLSELQSVDHIFIIPITVKFGAGADIQKQYVDLVAQIQPDCLITSAATDKYLAQKQANLKAIGVKLLQFKQTHPGSTTQILDRLQSEI